MFFTSAARLNLWSLLQCCFPTVHCLHHSFCWSRIPLRRTSFLLCSCSLLLFQESEKIIAELNETWEEKLRKTEAIRMERWVSSLDCVFSFHVSVTHGPEIWPPSFPASLPQSARVLSVCDTPAPAAPTCSSVCLFFPSFFNPSCAVLSHLFPLPFSFPLHSFCLFLLSSRLVTHGWTPAPIWHLFSPSHSLVCGCRRQPCHCLSTKCHRCQSLLSCYTSLVHVAHHQKLFLDFGCLLGKVNVSL